MPPGGSDALRVLALAYKPLKAPPQQQGANAAAGGLALTPADEDGLTFVGLVAMHDPPRAAVAAAIETCRLAGSGSCSVALQRVTLMPPHACPRTHGMPCTGQWARSHCMCSRL